MNGNIEERFKILIVEDQDGPAQVLKNTIEENLESVEIQIEKLQQAPSSMQLSWCEVVVLDLFLGNPTENNNQGQKRWEQIWERKLVPVIVHTAGECELDPAIPNDNPFLKCIKKQSGSDERVVEYLRSVMPHIKALRQVELEFNKAIHSVLEHVSPLIWQAEANDRLRPELLVRSARRRLAAMMDMKTLSTDEPMLSWEQYIYPPIDDSLLTGDILRTKDGNSEDPTAYRLVLTPSCDMVRHQGTTRVNQVLVAKCLHQDEYLRASQINMGTKLSKKVSEKLSTLLTQPQSGGHLLLPEYKFVLPLMSACMRDLELIPISDISIDGSDNQFKRVASIDSPFREQIIWAYLQIAGRPGIPDRDLNRWIDDIFETSQRPSRT